MGKVKKQDLLQNKLFWFYVLIGMIFLVTRLYDLRELPQGLNVDEAAMGYNAYCLAEYGVDRYLEPYPIVLRNYGNNQSPLYTYILMVLFRLAGYHTTFIRLPAVLFGGITLVCGTLIANRLLGRKGGCVIAALIALSPFFIQTSRLGLDCLLYLGTFTAAVYCMISAVESGKNILWLLAGVMSGLVLYSYVLSFLAMPVFALLCLGSLLSLRKIRWRQLLLYLIPLGILAVPMILFTLINLGWMEPIMTDMFSIIRISNDRISEMSLKNLADIGHIFQILWQLITNDGSAFIAVPEFGVLYYVSIPFLIGGLIAAFSDVFRAWRKREFSPETIVLSMFLSVLAAMILLEEPWLYRGNAIYFPLAYFTAKGALRLLQKAPRLFNAAAILYGVCAICFCSFYFTRYNEKYPSPGLFDSTFAETVAHIRLVFSEDTDIYFANLRGAVRHPEIYLMEYFTPSPYDCQPMDWLEEDMEAYLGNVFFQFSENYQKEAVYAINIAYLWENVERQEDLAENGFVSFDYNGYRIYYVPSYHGN